MATQTKNMNWLYGIIAVLATLLILQTCYLLLSRKNGAVPAKKSAVTVQQASHSSPSQTKPSTWFSSAAPARDETRKDPFAEMEHMQARMNRVFNTMMRYGPVIAQDLGSGFSSFHPAMDLQETESDYIVRVDLPGTDKDKIEISVRNMLLTVQGTREVESESADNNQGFYTQERSYGSFARTLTLPGPVNETSVKAEYKDGVLTIFLPKLSPGKEAQKIAVQ
ncbi:MAG: Hsp20/alpha crystallin family protein [Candidatus Omnitrophota bacterium]|nr:Hsp20/alpha crystallin family protein [Candidatus Omnitrophota bacterium]